MSEDEGPADFLEDDRVKFVEGKVAALLRVDRQSWEKIGVTEEFQSLLKNVFEKQPVIYFSSSRTRLSVSCEVCMFFIVVAHQNKINYPSTHKMHWEKEKINNDPPEQNEKKETWRRQQI